MELDMGNATVAAARAAGTTLAGLTHGPSIDESRIAKVARAAIFEEALLNALHARLAELRSVAK